MRSVNRLTVLGNVGSITVFDNVLKVSVATARTFKQDGERREKTDWVPITIFEPGMREWVEENVQKGDQVYVEARVSQSSYGEGDNKKYTVDVVASLFNKL